MPYHFEFWTHDRRLRNDPPRFLVEQLCALHRHVRDRRHLLPGEAVSRRTRSAAAVHGAAVALLGWYLLLPPDTGKPLPDTSLPLSMWKHGDALESEAACTTARKAAIAEFERQKAENEKMPGDPRRSWDKFHHDQVYRSACISTDDPLLEGTPSEHSSPWVPSR